MTYVSSKQRGKRAMALESDFETNIRYRMLTGCEELFGPFNARPHEVLVRRFLKYFTEKPEKMKTGKTSLTRNLIQIERFSS
jgi:hypothetical protein